MTDTELALFLTKAAAVYYDRRHLALARPAQDTAIQELDRPKVLSVQAIAGIVGVSEDHVRSVIGRDAGRPRGKLNPDHISYLGYVMSMRSKTYGLVKMMLDTGTSLSTIASLTNVSQATLYRWRKL